MCLLGLSSRHQHKRWRCIFIYVFPLYSPLCEYLSSLLFECTLSVLLVIVCMPINLFIIYLFCVCFYVKFSVLFRFYCMQKHLHSKKKGLHNKIHEYFVEQVIKNKKCFITCSQKHFCCLICSQLLLFKIELHKN